eukprot:evm.model.scf_64.16 EVM.evm.TU.scf_64.16   scf_64:135472-136319(+)
MKVSRGLDLLFTMRGLDRHARVVRSALTVEWGSLELVFVNQTEFSKFMAALKYVDVEEKPESCGFSILSWSSGLCKRIYDTAITSPKACGGIAIGVSVLCWLAFHRARARQ